MFLRHQSGFERLIRMANPGPAGSKSDSFSKLQDSLGISACESWGRGEVDLPVWGPWYQGDREEKGITYAPTPPTNIVKDLDASAAANESAMLMLYQHIQGNWYVYYGRWTS